MTSRNDKLLLSFAIFTLFGQSILSIALFAKTIPDGGYWPIVLAITTALNIFYSTFVLWLVQIKFSRTRNTALSTMVLAFCVFVLGNFGLFFGAQGHAALFKIGAAEVVSSDAMIYSLYAVFAAIPVLVRLGTRFSRRGH